MSYAVVAVGESRAFSDQPTFFTTAVPVSDAQVVVYLGGAPLQPHPEKCAVLVELATECLGYHTGERQGDEGSNVLGFSRYRNGADAPSPLIELVRQPHTLQRSVIVARSIFETAGLTVALCSDQAGRIIDRLVRPKYNAAMRLLDEALGTQQDIDLACKLGLGYPDGPIERTLRGGLAEHHEVCRALFEIYATPAYAPAQRAAVAMQRRRSGK